MRTRKPCECELCGCHIDRSAADSAPIVVSQNWYMAVRPSFIQGDPDVEYRVPRKKFVLCHDCGSRLLSRIVGEAFDNRIKRHEAAAQEAGA